MKMVAKSDAADVVRPKCALNAARSFMLHPDAQRTITRDSFLIKQLKRAGSAAINAKPWWNARKGATI